MEYRKPALWVCATANLHVLVNTGHIGNNTLQKAIMDSAFFLSLSFFILLLLLWNKLFVHRNDVEERQKATKVPSAASHQPHQKKPISLLRCYFAFGQTIHAIQFYSVHTVHTLHLIVIGYIVLHCICDCTYSLTARIRSMCCAFIVLVAIVFCCFFLVPCCECISARVPLQWYQIHASYTRQQAHVCVWAVLLHTIL